MHKYLILYVMTLGFVAQGALLEFSGKPVGEFEDNDKKFSVYPEATVKAEGLPAAKLKITGHGIREKKILFIVVDVYYAVSYSLEPEKVKGKTEPMAGFDETATKALHLTMMRDLSAEDITDAFEDGFEENGIDVDKKPALKNVLKKLTAEVKEGQAFVVVAHSKGEEDVLAFDLPGNDKDFQARGPKGMASDFWKLWFGKPGDGKLEDLKRMLVGLKVE